MELLPGSARSLRSLISYPICLDKSGLILKAFLPLPQQLLLLLCAAACCLIVCFSSDLCLLFLSLSFIMSMLFDKASLISLLQQSWLCKNVSIGFICRAENGLSELYGYFLTKAFFISFTGSVLLQLKSEQQKLVFFAVAGVTATFKAYK